MTKKEIRIATVGVGRFGINHLTAFKQYEETSNVKLVAASDLIPAKLQTAEEKFNINVYTDFKEMIDRENLDAISIATPDHLHDKIGLYALLKGLHVFVEKPLHIGSEEASEMVSVAQKNNLLLQVDFHKRYDPFHIEIKQLVDEKKFGDFLYGYCHMEDKIVVPRDWFTDWAHNSSPAWFLASNLVDLMSWLMDSKVVSVFARGQKIKLKSMGIDTYDSIQSMLTFENNAVINMDSSWILPEQFSSIVDQGFRLVGTEGIVEVDSEERGTTSCFSSENGVRNHNSGFIYDVRKPDGTIKQEGYGIKSIQAFADNLVFLNNGGSLQEIEGSYPSGIDGLKVTEVIEAIHQSIETGEIVSVGKMFCKEEYKL